MVEEVESELSLIVLLEVDPLSFRDDVLPETDSGAAGLEAWLLLATVTTVDVLVASPVITAVSPV